VGAEQLRWDVRGPGERARGPRGEPERARGAPGGRAARRACCWARLRELGLASAVGEDAARLRALARARQGRGRALDELGRRVRHARARGAPHGPLRRAARARPIRRPRTPVHRSRRSLAQLSRNRCPIPSRACAGCTARGRSSMGFPVAVKTGTSSGFRDAWTAGLHRTSGRWSCGWATRSGARDPRASLARTARARSSPTAMRRAMRRRRRTRAPLFDASLLEEHAVCPLSGERPHRGLPPRGRAALREGARAPRGLYAARTFAPRSPAICRRLGLRGRARWAPRGGRVARRVRVLARRATPRCAGRRRERSALARAKRGAWSRRREPQRAACRHAE
jgi:hypothetical protein